MFINTDQGHPQDLVRGGGQKIDFSDLEICMLRMAKPCALLGCSGA